MAKYLVISTLYEGDKHDELISIHKLNNFLYREAGFDHVMEAIAEIEFFEETIRTTVFKSAHDIGIILDRSKHLAEDISPDRRARKRQRTIEKVLELVREYHA